MTPLTLFAVTSAIVLALGSLKVEKSDSVYLIKDEDGKVGKISIKTDSEEKILDKDRLFVSIKGKNISEPSIIDEIEFNKRYGNLLLVEPKKPKLFILYFEQGSDNLTLESEALIDDILKEVAGRDDPEITILGHTDTVGNKESNYSLGLKRA
ncbi:MAG: OmpA family protein, partial [Calditerrivibrio sp.]|nr:OmpA family protein [Calditerrivibrio sp.]